MPSKEHQLSQKNPKGSLTAAKEPRTCIAESVDTDTRDLGSLVHRTGDNMPSSDDGAESESVKSVYLVTPLDK